MHFDLIEPLDHFFKDEVRALGTALGLPDYIVHRQPFPGLGLAIRVIGDVDVEKLEILKSSDAMTADWLKLPYGLLGRMSGRIVAEVPGVNRVFYDVTSKPPRRLSSSRIYVHARGVRTYYFS